LADLAEMAEMADLADFLRNLLSRTTFYSIFVSF